MKDKPAGSRACITEGLPAPARQLQMLQKLLRSSPDVICSFNEEGYFLSASAAAKAVWGYLPEELVGIKAIDLVCEADKARTQQAAQHLMEGHSINNFENSYICKDGSIKPILWSATWDAEEKILYAIAKDAHATRQAELQQKRLNRAYMLAEIAWWELDIAAQVYTCSDEIFEMYGLPVPPDNKVTLPEFLSFVHPDDAPRLQHDLEQLCNDTYFHYEHRIIKPNGDIAYLIHYSELVRNSEGQPVTLKGATKNITESRLHELQLQASEQRLKHILESIGDGFFTLDHNWNVTYWNKKAEEILGPKREDMLGKNLWEEYKEAVPLKFHSEYTKAVREQQAARFEEYFAPKQKWIEVSAYPSSEGLSVYFRDITGRKEQEINLKISNERFEFVSKATTDAIWDWDVVKNSNYFNEAFTKTYGHTNKPQALTDSWGDHLYPADKKRITESINQALHNPAATTWEGEYRFIKADGTIAQVYDRAIIIRNEKGEGIRMIGSMQDISKIKETEKAISKAIISTQEKERSEIGKELHDNVNQILTTIKLYIENIRDYPDHRTQFIDKSVTLAQKAINEIRTLSRQLVTPVMADLGFEATLAELVEHYKSLSLFAITLQFDCNEATIDKNMQLTIYRIMQEQLNNIVKYAKATQVQLKVVQQHQTLQVLVADNGVGFDAGKTPNGLGLRNIEHRSHIFKGIMTLQTAPGAGCKLFINFPLS